MDPSGHGEIEFDPSTFVGGLGAGDRRALLDAVRPRRFGAGDSVFVAGGTDTRVAVMLTGRVKLEAHASSGRRVLLGLRGPGELLGELRALDGLARGAHVIALDAVTAGLLPIRAFAALVAERPQLSLALLRMLAGRLREADRGRLQLGTSDAVGRVCGCLLELARLYGVERSGHVELRTPLSQEELGSWAGLSRQATARALGRLRESGLVSNRGRRYELHDLAELAHLAQR